MWQCNFVDGTQYTAPDGADHDRLEFEHEARKANVPPEALEHCWRIWQAASRDRLNPRAPRYFYEPG